MICEKLPETKEQIIEQLAKQKVVGLRSTILFLKGVQTFKCWNEQPATKEYMMKIRPLIIEILGELKASE